MIVFIVGKLNHDGKENDRPEIEVGMNAKKKTSLISSNKIIFSSAEVNKQEKITFTGTNGNIYSNFSFHFHQPI